jgi:hypothetical protein
MKDMEENTIAQFFVDTGFVAPRQHNMYDFGFGFDGGGDEDMKLTGYDGIPDNVADIRGDLNDPRAAEDHPLASIYGDYYMFVDPGARTNLDNKEPLSPEANRTNVEYHKKDLSRIDSASDVHLETLEQPVSEFPRHQQSRSQMEPSVLGDDQQPGEIVLEQPQVFEGVEYPAGTRILVEMSAEDIYTEDEMKDDLFENPDAKLCPLCYEPYVGDVCPACKSGKPGPGAIRVNEDIEGLSGLGAEEMEPWRNGWQIPGQYTEILRDLEKQGAAGSALVRGLSQQARISIPRAMGVVKQFLDMNGYYTKDIDRHSLYNQKEGE